MTVMAASPSSYPVDIDVQPQLAERNRLTVAFRFILAIPHILIVGGGPIAVGFGLGSRGGFGYWGNFGSNGVLGVAAGVCAVIAWFAILFTSAHPRGLWDFCHLYLRWRIRAMAYMALLRDEYPPFGDGEIRGACDDQEPCGGMGTQGCAHGRDRARRVSDTRRFGAAPPRGPR